MPEGGGNEEHTGLDGGDDDNHNCSGCNLDDEGNVEGDSDDNHNHNHNHNHIDDDEDKNKENQNAVCNHDCDGESIGSVKKNENDQGDNDVDSGEDSDRDGDGDCDDNLHLEGTLSLDKANSTHDAQTCVQVVRAECSPDTYATDCRGRGDNLRKRPRAGLREVTTRPAKAVVLGGTCEESLSASGASRQDSGSVTRAVPPHLHGGGALSPRCVQAGAHLCAGSVPCAVKEDIKIVEAVARKTEAKTHEEDAGEEDNDMEAGSVVEGDAEMEIEVDGSSEVDADDDVGGVGDDVGGGDCDAEESETASIQREGAAVSSIATPSGGPMHLLHRVTIVHPSAVPAAITGALACAKDAESCRKRRAEAMERFRRKKAVRCYGRRVRYQIRKRIATTRPRVNGRFAKRSDLDAVKVG